MTRSVPLPSKTCLSNAVGLHFVKPVNAINPTPGFLYSKPIRPLCAFTLSGLHCLCLETLANDFSTNSLLLSCTATQLPIWPPSLISSATKRTTTRRTSIESASLQSVRRHIPNSQPVRKKHKRLIPMPIHPIPFIPGASQASSGVPYIQALPCCYRSASSACIN
ncbi:hypothetical protein BKA61DRAFT_342008 [Leptodontidium sp. MPI-SDFR-AT-0119]|nr:hypothetical protein BKA61DRAFT_342008 [Leptodontidium sp. MPI-SDFR-AT-0119]